MNTLLRILQVINSIPLVIATVETVIKGSGKGSDKRAMVEAEIMKSLELTFDVTGKDVDLKSFRKNLRKAVDGIVGMLNDTGAFK